MEIARWLGFGRRWRTTVAVCSGFGDQKIGYKEEDVLHWFRMVAGTGRLPELEEQQSWPKMENDGGGSCVENDGGGLCLVVDGGKKMGRWREGGKNLGEALK
jgi:hypothetical protein